MPPAAGTAIAIGLLWDPVGFNYARVVLMRSWPAPAPLSPLEPQIPFCTLTSCCGSIGTLGPPLGLPSKWRKSLRDLKGFIKFVNSTKSRAVLPAAAHVLTPSRQVALNRIRGWGRDANDSRPSRS